MPESLFHLSEFWFSCLTGMDHFHYNLKGLALLLFAVLSAVGYNLTLSRLVGKYSPVYIVNVQNIIGATLFLPLFMITDFKTFYSSQLYSRNVSAGYCPGSICFMQRIHSFCLLSFKNRYSESKCLYQFHTSFHGSVFIHSNGRQAYISEYYWE